MADSATQSQTRVFRSYLYIAGTILTVAVFLVQLNPGLLGLEHMFDLWPFLLLTAFGVLTRFLSIQAPVAKMTVILDTPVYLTAIFTLGTLQGGLVVYTSMVVYFAWRTVLRKSNPNAERRPLADLLGIALYSSSMTTLVMVLLAWVFRIDADLHTFSRAPGYGLIPVVGMCFLFCQYTLAVVPYMLKGVPFKRIMKNVILPGILVEVILLQLAVLAVITFERSDLTPFLLLATTYVFVNYVVRRLSQISVSQSRQVAELETLNRLGQTVCTTLDTPELVARFAHESLQLFDEAEAFVLSYTTGEHGSGTQVDVQGRQGQEPKNFPMVAALELATEAEESGRLILRTNEAGSWMVVPITAKEENMGIIALWTSTMDCFNERDLQFLSTLAHQATFALENARLYGLATVDSLTGLYLRRYFEDRLRDEFARVDRYDGHCSVVLLDVDWLKRINDSLGHPVGDAALTHVARIVCDETRLLDVPARLGGDEFSILLPNENAEMARMVAERIRARIADTPIMNGTQPVRVTVSMGVASYPEHKAESPSDLVALADRALYQSKLEPERNRVAVFQPTN